jgi:catechol 2,3-dioxygenase-like lactoylglutathione lyase family enzyme
MTSNRGDDMPGPLDNARLVTKVPAHDLDRARRWYRDHLGLEPREARDGGLRYVCGDTEFHLFESTGRASGNSTQMGFEVDDLEVVVAALREGNLFGIGQATGPAA